MFCRALQFQQRRKPNLIQSSVARKSHIVFEMKKMNTFLLFVVGILFLFVQKPFERGKRIPANDAASSATQGSDGRDFSFSSFPSAGSDFEVFLSFRGEDVRNSLADNVYNALVKAGIRTFKDDEEIQFGEEFPPALFSAIHQSKIAIPILSKDFASSKWCLREIAEIMERRVHGQITVMPIFYHVDPSEVRDQSGCFERAFQKHDNILDQNTLQRWRKALQDVSKLKGWSSASWREGKLIEEIIKTVKKKLINRTAARPGVK